MHATTKHLLTAAATALFAIAATATTVTNAFAQTTPAKQEQTAEPTKSGQSTGLTREQVQKEFLDARKNGTLIETEADMDVAQTRKHHAK